jgi:hypothetical protein
MVFEGDEQQLTVLRVRKIEAELSAMPQRLMSCVWINKRAEPLIGGPALIHRQVSESVPRPAAA